MNFKKLDELIHSGEKDIEVDEDVILDDGEELEYANGIRLDVNELYIDFFDRTIDAKGKARIFDVVAFTNLQGVVLKNGWHEEKGGAILNENQGDLTLSMCRFENNDCKKGSAIYNEYGDLIVESSHFEHNSGGDGIIFNKDGNLDITYCNFGYNEVDNCGGVLYNDEGGIVAISESVFEDNKSKKGAGVIYNGEDGDISVENCEFICNKSESDGGVIKNYGDLNIEGSEFECNASQGGCGGAIYNGRDAVLSINDSSVGDNDPDGIFEEK